MYSTNYLIYNICKRNNISVSEPKAGHQLKVDEETFMKWYHFYRKHFNKKMSESEWNEFLGKYHKKEDVSKYLPTGNWREG